MSEADQVRTQLTDLLQDAPLGDAAVMNRVLPLVYEELRAMAHGQLVREVEPRSIGTTALVHEAYLKLVDDTRVTARGRAYFFGAAARAMRQVLVDYARRRTAAKRGGGQAPISLDEARIAVDAFATELLDLNDALDRLAALNTRHARVVEYRFFGGLSVEETAAALDVSARTIKHDWALARAWLYDTLRAPAEGST